MLAEVASAKLLLCCCAVILTVGLHATSKIFRMHPDFMVSAFFWGIAQGCNFVWYFQGMGRISEAARIEVGARVCAAALCLIFVHSGKQAWLIVALNAAASMTATGLTAVIAHRSVPFTRLTIGRGVRGLRDGFTMFVFRSAVSLYTLGNSFILGSICSPTVVGYYAGSERISKGILSLVQPINQSMYAEINRAMAKDKVQAAQIAKRSLILMTGIGLIMGLFVFIGAPVLVRLFLGKSFEPAIRSTRIMACLPPLVCLATSLGSNWMLPLHLDRQFNWCIAAAGLLNVTLAFLLAPSLQHVGMAIAVGSSEACVVVTLYCYLRLTGYNPFRLARLSSSTEDAPGRISAA